MPERRLANARIGYGGYIYQPGHEHVWLDVTTMTDLSKGVQRRLCRDCSLEFATDMRILDCAPLEPRV